MEWRIFLMDGGQDDFLIAGFGNIDQEVNRSLEEHERAFFEKCRA